MRACVVVFPGINADAEMVHTLRDVCGAPTTVAWHTDTDAPARGRPRRDPGRLQLRRLPADGRHRQGEPHRRAPSARTPSAAATCSASATASRSSPRWACSRARSRATRSQRFECGDWYVKVDRPGPVHAASSGDVWRLPIAHGEGRYQADRGRRCSALEGEGRIGLRYCTAAGEVDRRAPTRTAASTRSPASTAAPRKNVFGLMPHPERMSEAILGCADGASSSRASSAACAS